MRTAKLWLTLLMIPVLLLAEEKKSRGPRAIGEVTLRLIEADSSSAGSNDAADLVPAELKTLLRFTRYRLLDSAYLRGSESQNMRVALAGGLSGRVRFEVRARQPVVLIEFDVEIDGPPGGERERRLLETTTTAKSGETVVLGASRMRDSSNALIVLLMGKLLP